MPFLYPSPQYPGETYIYPVEHPLVTATLLQQLLQLPAQLLEGECPLARAF